jgi:excisionase family DNA binding protein
MPENDLPKILTIKETATYLKVDEDTILDELKKGRLHGFKVADQWRCSDTDLLAYIRGDRNGAESDQQKTHTVSPAGTMWELTDIDAFDFNWPKTGGGNVTEHYDKAFEATRDINGNPLTFKLGFGNRNVAGLLRRKVTIWHGNRAIVEFTSSNDYESDRLLAGVIRLRNGAQLTPSQKIPDEYKNFKIQRYNSIVKGARASTNMAVVVDKDDLRTMLEHAYIRAVWKQLI